MNYFPLALIFPWIPPSQFPASEGPHCFLFCFDILPLPKVLPFIEDPSEGSLTALLSVKHPRPCTIGINELSWFRYVTAQVSNLGRTVSLLFPPVTRLPHQRHSIRNASIPRGWMWWDQMCMESSVSCACHPRAKLTTLLRTTWASAFPGTQPQGFW